MRNTTRPLKFAGSAAAILGAGALAFGVSNATAKSVPGKSVKAAKAPKIGVRPEPTNSQARLTNGVWSVTATPPSQAPQAKPAPQAPLPSASLHFHGDFVTIVTDRQTLYGTFNSGKVAISKTDVDMQGHVVLAMSAVHYRAPKLHTKGKQNFKMRLVVHKAGLKGSVCVTAPGDIKTALTTAAIGAKNPKGVSCWPLEYVAGPALEKNARARSEESAPGKKKIKMRTRGLDWSLGR